jgi:hypothetical protein
MAHLVRSLELTPEHFSHDWHVQPSCQRPNRNPPERCASVRADSHKCESACPRNLTKLPWLVRHCQLTGITGLPQDLHIVEGVNRFDREELFSSLAHDRPLLPPRKIDFSARAEAEVGNLKKDRLEVLR